MRAVSPEGHWGGPDTGRADTRSRAMAPRSRTSGLGKPRRVPGFVVRYRTEERLSTASLTRNDGGFFGQRKLRCLRRDLPIILCNEQLTGKESLGFEARTMPQCWHVRQNPWVTEEIYTMRSLRTLATASDFE